MSSDSNSLSVAMQEILHASWEELSTQVDALAVLRHLNEYCEYFPQIQQHKDVSDLFRLSESKFPSIKQYLRKEPESFKESPNCTDYRILDGDGYDSSPVRGFFEQKRWLNQFMKNPATASHLQKRVDEVSRCIREGDAPRYPRSFSISHLDVPLPSKGAKDAVRDSISTQVRLEAIEGRVADRLPEEVHPNNRQAVEWYRSVKGRYNTLSADALTHGLKRPHSAELEPEPGYQQASTTAQEPTELRKAKRQQTSLQCATQLSAADLERTDRSREATPKQTEQSGQENLITVPSISALQRPLHSHSSPQDHIFLSEGEMQWAQLEQSGSGSVLAYRSSALTESQEGPFPQSATLSSHPDRQAVLQTHEPSQVPPELVVQLELPDPIVGTTSSLPPPKANQQIHTDVWRYALEIPSTSFDPYGNQAMSNSSLGYGSMASDIPSSGAAMGDGNFNTQMPVTAFDPYGDRAPMSAIDFNAQMPATAFDPYGNQAPMSGINFNMEMPGNNDGWY